MPEYQLFPDIKLIIGKYDTTSVMNAAVVNFCISGMCEYSVGQQYYYLKADNCMVLQNVNFPGTGISYSYDYRGITLLIDSQYRDAAFSDFLDMQELFRKMSRRERCILSADEKMRMLFSDIYKEHNSSKAAVLRIKVLELLMLLNERKIAVCAQQGLIEQIGEFICRNTSDHYTISELSEMFRINPTTLKSMFRQVFGSPVYSYTKYRKMFRAAELMCTSDMRIIDIAEEVGYCNPSKFSGAFREVVGVNPKYYQMEHKKLYADRNCLISENLTY